MHILSPVTDNLNQRKEKRKYVARPGIEPRTPDLRVRCPTDCATRPGPSVVECKLNQWCLNSHNAVFQGGLVQSNMMAPPGSENICCASLSRAIIWVSKGGYYVYWRMIRLYWVVSLTACTAYVGLRHITCENVTFLTIQVSWLASILPWERMIHFFWLHSPDQYVLVLWL